MTKNNYMREYYIKNRESLLDSIKKNQRRKYKEDLEYNLKQRLESRINETLPNNNYELEELLGCNLPFYRKYIKYCLQGNQLEDINHITPINSYPDNEKHLAFHWSNTYPLSSSINRSIKDNVDTNTIEFQKQKVNEFISQHLPEYV
jgi:hypothetical protein